jgi:disulfide bond formation protein DsbB
VFAGEAECAAAGKKPVLGLPIPIWSALAFLAMGAAAVAGAWRSRQAGKGKPSEGV